MSVAAEPALRGLKVLLIEDEPHIRRLVRRAVEAEGARVMEAGTAREGISLAAAERPALIVLDLGLPDRPGLAVCRDIRSWSEAPIVVLSARHADGDKAALLDAGADDYVTKPFSTVEFLARLRVQRRRTVASARTVVEIGDLRLDVERRLVERAGRPVHLTPTEWELLTVLVRHAGRLLGHAQIFREVWPASSGDAQAYLRVHISNLRRKLERDPVRPELITTEAGVGYRFRALD